MHDITSATGEGGKLCFNRSRAMSKLPGKEGGNRSGRKVDYDDLLVEPSPKTHKRGSCPVIRVTPNTKNRSACSDNTVIKILCEEVDGKVIYLQSCGSKSSQDA